MASFWQIPLGSFALTVLFTPVVKYCLQKMNFWNAQDSEHDDPVVRGGGFAIAVAFILSAYVTALVFHCRWICMLTRFLPAASLLLITGIIDDRWGICPWKKLLLQSLSALLLWIGGYRIHYFLIWPVNDFWSIMLTVFWGVAVLNAFNLIDGLDGLCTGNAMIAASAFCMIAVLTRNTSVMQVSLLILGGCLGFLLFNFHPAKVFLGDTGSLFLGLASCALSLRVTEGNFGVTNMVVMLLIFWIPFCDMGLAVWRRKVKAMMKSSGCEIMGRDMYHTHYRLKNLVQSHTLAVLIMWFGMVAFDVFALLIFVMRMTDFTVLILLAICLFSLLTMARYEISYTSCLIRHVLSRTRKVATRG